MTSTATHNVKAAILVAFALALGAMGIFVARAGDAPGAAVFGMLLMVVGVVLGVRAARQRLALWAARTVVAVGIAAAAFAAFLTHAVVLSAPLFPQAQELPSVMDPAPSPQHAAAAERAREAVHAAIRAQNLPGVSVAVGAGGVLVWAEGFGWRDVDTRTPVKPATRFNIGTAASTITANASALGLTDTGADSAAQWSPEAIGEPGEDFPPFTLIRHTILQPLGLAPAEYPLPGDRATFYVPTTFWRDSATDPRVGRRLMAMRDLACCAGTMASYSTASDLVRVGLASGGSIDGELAGGTVMSLITQGDSGIVVAVLSNIAHANTAALARTIGDAFAESPSRR